MEIEEFSAGDVSKRSPLQQPSGAEVDPGVIPIESSNVLSQAVAETFIIPPEGINVSDLASHLGTTEEAITLLLQENEGEQLQGSVEIEAQQDPSGMIDLTVMVETLGRYLGAKALHPERRSLTEKASFSAGVPLIQHPADAQELDGTNVSSIINYR